MTSMAAEIKVSLDSTDLFIFSGAAGDGIIAELIKWDDPVYVTANFLSKKSLIEEIICILDLQSTIYVKNVLASALSPLKLYISHNEIQTILHQIWKIFIGYLCVSELTKKLPHFALKLSTISNLNIWLIC